MPRHRVSSPSCFRGEGRREGHLEPANGREGWRLTMSFRMLGPHERGRFAPEAWGHLLALSGSGALNSTELEHIIERALVQIDGRIALDDLRSLMEGAGFSEPGDTDQHQTRSEERRVGKEC